MDETSFLLIRHAESIWNAGGRWQGHGDPPLSPRGRAQAAELAERLAGEGIELLIASDLARCTETAAILGARWGLVPSPDPRLREIDIGAWTGLTREQIEAREADLLARFEAEDLEARPGGGEAVRGRVTTRRWCKWCALSPDLSRDRLTLPHPGQYWLSRPRTSRARSP